MFSNSICFTVYLTLFFHFSIYATPPYLQNPDENKIREIIANELPEFDIDSIEINDSGWDNFVADINGEWIFRFSKDEKNARLLAQEHLLLDYLQNHISIQTPLYEYMGQHVSFAQYRKIIGDPLSTEHYTSLQDEQQQEIAESLALFLAQLHSAISIEQAFTWGYETYKPPLDDIETALQKRFLNYEITFMVQEVLNYVRILEKTKYEVVLHNDLHPGNIIYDPFSKQINGVIDFSNVKIGNYPLEFGDLFGIHEDLAIRTAKTYSDLTGLPNPTLSGLAYYILHRTLSTFRARETKDITRELHLIKKLEYLTEVWNSLKG